ncbi:hypothetical protein [Saccharopolyspora endophytica]|uniref:Uncharacterized protein n=1 Tax=Saccharopolyspora endophytica TaxID=543886 RepID=A0ABS5DQG5_9PSEU|nr:hypothetical protein [Saccharopolyspora endophytica]MBQ0928568.1 hypothetical protein [Saccharopolyspora endophytica]
MTRTLERPTIPECELQELLADVTKYLLGLGSSGVYGNTCPNCSGPMIPPQDGGDPVCPKC